MELYKINGILNLNLNIAATIALTCFLIILGKIVKRRISILDRLCIPGPVIGGIFFALLVFLLNQFNILTIVLDTGLQSTFMVAFFTTVGIGASFSLIKKGGKSVLIYWIFCIILIFSQNIIGLLGALLTGLDPLLGLMCGAISMGGGHGTSATFGPTLESMGVVGANTIGLAAATLGLICGGFVGAPTSKFLIEKYKLKPNDSLSNNLHNHSEIEDDMNSEIAVASDSKISSKLDSSEFIKHICILTTCMSLGYVVSNFIGKITGYSLPEYVGGILVAILFRNSNDKFKFIDVDYSCFELLGDISLNLFLTMALMSIKLWELKTLGLPMLIIVLMQVLFIILFTVFVMFKLLGKDYDAAVMVGGFIGHELGATPNALANLNSICSRYGYSEKAFFTIPIVCAILIDLVAIPTIIMFINMLS
ncbi:sodium/glutamate symporter [[Clostridium] bifermentans ATCC 638]|uniref:Sodium/glutamate symporter n=1 Tax=Paraclostridium bifermentans ATCC 638 = DSM 14991 TaxID=1233171 RepID=T4VR44_PARBF|nr:sodium/glutamate symporter [Paraclostridium bifermentans]EQK43231.1 sodium/glutamate symporter [[Clostridium] bifermentans ATCC 638] [Paraclostridium bifermentans ATCC 638 = DSM 14991]RIZ60454.1 sodium/glutamate symporter [Paraclostridium bifermentans]UAG17096.1 sodium/glutamate symporter [Paraclostridium bifermentans]